VVRIFGRDSVYVEVQRHREREEEWRNQGAIRIAGSLKLPVLATNGVRYATAYDREVLDVFTVVRYHPDLDHAGRLLALNNRRHLRPGREMVALFRDVPGAVAETFELSSRLRFQLDDLGYEFPHYPVPDGETMDSFLRKRVA
jgi:error-prone DNA polymerase